MLKKEATKETKAVVKPEVRKNVSKATETQGTDKPGENDKVLSGVKGPEGQPVYLGPRGGEYYINKNGNKTYLKADKK